MSSLSSTLYVATNNIGSLLGNYSTIFILAYLLYVYTPYTVSSMISGDDGSNSNDDNNNNNNVEMYTEGSTYLSESLYNDTTTDTHHHHMAYNKNMDPTTQLYSVLFPYFYNPRSPSNSPFYAFSGPLASFFETVPFLCFYASVVTLLKYHIFLTPASLFWCCCQLCWLWHLYASYSTTTTTTHAMGNSDIYPQDHNLFSEEEEENIPFSYASSFVYYWLGTYFQVFFSMTLIHTTLTVKAKNIELP